MEKIDFIYTLVYCFGAGACRACQKSFRQNINSSGWKPLTEAAAPAANPAYTAYTHIAFADDKRGIISGGYSPLRAGRDLADWIDPKTALRRRQVATLALELDSKDGGVTWASSTAP